MVDPVKLKPITVVALLETVNPFASASPPLAPSTVTPSTSNWKPPITASVLYKISICSVGTSGQLAKSQTNEPSQQSEKPVY